MAFLSPISHVVNGPKPGILLQWWNSNTAPPKVAAAISVDRFMAKQTQVRIHPPEPTYVV